MTESRRRIRTLTTSSMSFDARDTCAPDDSEFYAHDRHGDLIRVTRFGYPKVDDYSAGYVINSRTGRFWKAAHWLPLDFAPPPSPGDQAMSKKIDAAAIRAAKGEG